MSQARLLVTLLMLGLAASACQPSQLNFRTDDRLDFVRPEARTLVRTPLDVEWQIRDFSIVPPGSAPASKNAGYFAVFVDRAPIKPARTMRDVAEDDQQCLHRPGCPDKEYLEERRIFTTTDQRITLTQIPPIPGDKEKLQLHAITVVLMDTSGHRIGESAWQLDVRMRKIGL